MVDFNALIMRKTFIDIYFFAKVNSLGIDSCLYEIPKNDLVDDMKLWPPVTSPMCTVTVLPHGNSGILHWGKAESIQLCAFLVGQATTAAEAQFWLRQP